MTRAGHKRAGRRAGPHRTCIGCRKLQPEQDLLRVVANADGEVFPDLFGKLPGRGAHLCPDLACFRKAVERQSFGRAFRRKIQTPDPADLARRFEDHASSQAMAILATARRSGYVQVGRDEVLAGLQREKAPLVLMATDASPASIAKLGRKAEQAGATWICAFRKSELGKLHHGKELAVLSLNHRGMAKRLRQELDHLEKLVRSRIDDEHSIEKRAGNARQGLTRKSLRGKMPRT